MGAKTIATFAALAVAAACDNAPESVAGPDLGRQPAPPQGQPGPPGMTAATAVTGSGHYVNTAGVWRTFSFNVRRKPDGRVTGTFQLVGHRNPPARFHGRLTCFRVVGNEARVGGIFEKSTNAALVGTGFGFYAQDNGQGQGANPDLLGRHVRGQIPDEWCAGDAVNWQYVLPIASGNIQIHWD